jgi:hypothetical protein
MTQKSQKIGLHGRTHRQYRMTLLSVILLDLILILFGLSNERRFERFGLGSYWEGWEVSVAHGYFQVTVWHDAAGSMIQPHWSQPTALPTGTYRFGVTEFSGDYLGIWYFSNEATPRSVMKITYFAVHLGVFIVLFGIKPAIWIVTDFVFYFRDRRSREQRGFEPIFTETPTPPVPVAHIAESASSAQPR